ncbi:MAG: ATP-binding protein [Frankiales bacterium]|nr:ATP-binding protein [Frankiales bacterium]
MAAALGTDAFAADVRDLPEAPGDLARVLRDWVRGALLGERCLVLEVGDEPDDRLRAAIARVHGPLVVSGAAAAIDGDGARPVIRQDVPAPQLQERRARWAAAYAAAGGETPPHATLDAVAAEYRLGPSTVAAVCAEAVAAGGDAGTAVREACRRRTRALLDPLADRVDTTRTASLVVPADVRDQIDQFVEHVRRAADVQARWPYDLPGTAAMFTGPSGTGKTLAATEVAARAGLDLYRVDLSLVVSKYVGETEKNLRRVFAGADQGGALLLFDEADALFGKRTDTKDGHDRYANLEVAYLLQRMEQSRAPSILTTNIADAVDPAFLRRLRFVVTFPFPDEAVRAQLWQVAFPPGVSTKDLDVARLARLGVHGAAIRDIALRATVLAGDAPVTMALVREAARAELRKEGRDVPPEIGEWS